MLMFQKILLSLLLLSSTYAGLTNGIAVVVNKSIITLYDIDITMQMKNITKEQAVVLLIDKLLYDAEVKRLNISISRYEIEDYVGKLANANKMAIDKFKEVVKKQQDYNIFLKDVEKRLFSQKLSTKLAGGKLKMASKEDVKIYYENNIEEFKVAKDSIEILPLEEVKDKVFGLIMRQREQEYLKEYFETLKITASIKIIR